jgi:outer membrane lipoprotein-sorting protein
MKMKHLIFWSLNAVFFLLSNATNAQDATSILNNVDKLLFAPKDQQSEVQLILSDKSGNQRIREAQLWQKGKEKRLFRFTAPAAEAGIGFLSLPDEVMYLYMPAFGKERRIASHVKNQPFAGTDFTYEDMESVNYASKYKAELLSQDDKLWHLKLIPLEGVRSEYAWVEVHVDKQHNYPLRMESYDRSGKKVKSSLYTFEKDGSYWYPKEVHMTDLKRNHSTRMIIKTIKFDSNLSDDLFTVRSLVDY